MIEIFAYGVFGLIIGSFLNVLIIRGGVRALGGRSICMSCGQKIHWFDLLPVISWVILHGRCRMCSSRISIQYPLVEFLTAFLFACIGVSPLPFLLRALGLPIAAILLAIAAYDIRHTIIPDGWAYSFALLAFISQFLAPFSGGFNWWFIFAGPAVALPLFLLWLFSRGRWMGLGDAKLALGIGWLLGPLYGGVAIFLAFILGAVIGLLLIFFSSALWKNMVNGFTPYHFSLFVKSGKGLTMKSEVPFGPFLITACLLVWFSLIYSIPIPFLWQ